MLQKACVLLGCLSVFFLAGCDDDSATKMATDGGTDASVVDSSTPDAGSTDAAAPAPIIASFTASPGFIPPGGTPTTITLTWSVQNATSLSISGGVGDVTGKTTITTQVSAATTFTLTATGSDNTITTAIASVALDDGTLGTYVDPVNGSDTNDGRPGTPFKSIDKAASVATSGKTIFLAAGNYAPPTSFTSGAVMIPANVGITGLGVVTLTGAPSTAALTLKGSSSISNIQIANFSRGINITTGTVSISGVQFTMCGDSDTGDSAINVSGDAKVTVTPGALTNYIVAPTQNFAWVQGTASLEIDGGAIKGVGNSPFSGAWLMNASGTGQLTLNGVTLDSNMLDAINLQDQSVVTVKGGSVINNCAATSGGYAIKIGGNPTFILDGSTISATPSAAMYSSDSVQPTITFQNKAVLTGSTGAAMFAYNAKLTINNSTVSNNGGALQMNAGSFTSMGGSVIKGSTTDGVDLRVGGVFQVSVHNTSFTGNAVYGINAVVDPTSTFDFGTVATPGGNTFTGNGTSNFVISSALAADNMLVPAVGNTWDPTANGATAAGVFPAGTTLVAPPNVTGANINLTQGGTPTSMLQLLLTP